ncbi:MAG: hypothetical protein LZF86_140013 [Nitrospira sp.]|nr:MAG: hypothetical protein LZF86_140013 [Nitrospira sp.]
MFGPDFYPTPRTVANAMLKKINPEAIHFLEPSAGKGDLAMAVLRAGEMGYHGRSRYRIDVIEAQPDLVNVLRAKEGLTIVGYDWLTYAGVSYYDAIVMNPPFSEGAAHLLKAWDFLHTGEIVCLLNQETIDNPYTAERKRLVTLIAEHGTMESLGACFAKAERATDVQVALVYLKKTSGDDRIDLWDARATERSVDDDIGSPESMPALRDTLGNMQHYYDQALEEMFKGFAHIRKASVFMEALGAPIRAARGDGEGPDMGGIMKLAQTNVTAARAEFATKLRRGAWMHVFEQVEFTKWLDSKQTEELLWDLERGSTVPFTAKNIKGTLTNIFLQRTKLFEQSVWTVFVALTQHYKGNTTGDIGSGDGRTGWKTNDSYKVNRKLVFPYGCRFSYGHFDLWSYRDAGAVYSDLDRVLCVLDGTKFEECQTVVQSLQDAFHAKRGQPGTCESAYFHIRYFKKGTVHLVWKRKDLLDRFNITAAAGRNWVGATTQQNAV